MLSFHVLRCVCGVLVGVAHGVSTRLRAVLAAGGNAPVVDAPKDVRVILVGQAPGVTEITTRQPFTGLAIKELLGIRRLSEAVGETYGYDGVVYVPLPHPSGASTWLNAPENKARLIGALAVLGELVGASRIGGSDA